MTLLSRARVAAAGVVIASCFAAAPGFAQDISESHLKAARTAITALHSTSEFDVILPQAARALKDQLVQQNPDLADAIDKTVNDKAMAMTARYGDLEKEAATVYAKVFSEADLNAIATFYSSEAGKKLLSDGPIVTRELLKAAEIWQRGIARDLAQEVGDDLAKQVNAAKAASGAAAPAAGTQDGGTTAPAQPPAQN